MGQHPLRRPPKFVKGYIDRHGKPRFYFRRAGWKSVALPGLPWSPEFMLAYEIAVAGQPGEIGASRTKPGTLRALAVSYYSSQEFRSMTTKAARRNVIERFCEQTDSGSQKYGDKRAATLQKEHIKKLMAERAEKPDSANSLRKALRALMKHAIDIKLRTDDPTQGVLAIAPKSKIGYHRWTESEITQFEQRHAIGSRARLALALGLHTGQARADVIKMGEQHIRDEVLSLVRGKTEKTTGIELAIPVHPELRNIIDATPSGHLTFLVTEFGRPFTNAGFGNWFREQCDMAGLHHCTFHGLRKAASVRLAEAGCTPHEIAAITGHASLKEIERYTKTAERRRLARSAIEKVSKQTTGV